MTDSPCLSRAPLAATDPNVRSLGLSPTKPVLERGSSSASMILGSSSISQSVDDVGLRQVDDESAAGPSFLLKSKRSIALLLGRARHPFENTTLTPTTADSQAVGSTQVCRVPLPSSAKHVSRDHAIVFHSPFGKSWAIKILGQNGLIVNGKRRRAGLVLRLEPYTSTLDFFGVHCLFIGDDRDIKATTCGGSDSSVQTRVEEEDQRGLSPSKPLDGQVGRKTLGTATSLSASIQRWSPSRIEAKSPFGRRLVGNAQKRPQGAPPSPPTSSPVHLTLSSPSKSSRLSMPPTSVFSSSPGHGFGADQSALDQSDSSDDECQDSTSSPSLSRKTSRHDDSGIAFQEEIDEEEASQALKLADQSAPQEPMVAMDDSGIDEEEVSPSPSPIPQSKRLPRKQVTFISQPIPSASSNQLPVSDETAIDDGLTDQPSSITSIQDLQDHLRRAVSHLAETYDVQGLLAEAIVFHRTATISATEAVRSVLTSNPSLLRGEFGPAAGSEKGQVVTGWTFDQLQQDGNLDEIEVDKEKLDVWQRKAWREKLEECLLDGDCFGIISRAGKDASGHPLECWYYYDKENDSDHDRAANLGALAKPMRAALKTHKPIFWKKSAYGHSNNADVSKGDACMATESQWGSSGSTLDSLLFSKAVESRGKEGNLAAKSAVLSSWEETQYEERERTWDRVGDDDFEMRAAKRVRRRR